MPLVLSLLLGLAQPLVQGPDFIAVGVRYPASEDVDRMRKEFEALRRAGFNAVSTSVSWRDGEPRRGAYNLLNVDRLIAVAAQAGLRVRIYVDTESEPAWKTDGTNALAGQFFDYVRRRLAANPAVLEVLFGRQPPGHSITIGTGPQASTPRHARLALWQAIAAGARRLEFIDADGPVSPSLLAVSEAVGVITRNQALFAPLKPRALSADEVTIEGGSATVTVRLLESAEAMTIVAMNHAAEVRKVTITFQPGIPEAIWQNMEEGVAVHFVMTASGPVLEHTFAPEDVLVLAIRKKLR